jgi:S1-C subfamily serine protease
LGTTTQISIERGGKGSVLDLVLASAPEIPPREEKTIDGNSPFAGLTVDNLSPAVAEELSVSTGTEGVIVRAVEGDSLAERVGFKRGDLVLEVNNTKIADTRALARIAASQPAFWKLAVGRDGQILRMAFR